MGAKDRGASKGLDVELRKGSRMSKDLEDYCPMSTERLGFQPERIIYRELVPNDDDPDSSRYREICLARRFDVRKFAQLIEDMAEEGYGSLRLDPPEEQILDIPVWERSVIVIRLPLGSKYTFGDPAIRLKKLADGRCPNDLYGGLTYVDQGGRPHHHHIPNCKLVYFYAERRRGTEKHPHIQSFLYNVPEVGRGFLTDIDPDIRHPGNGGKDVEDGG
jgi:hypothetical protein